MKIRPGEPSFSLRTDRQTDMTKLIVSFLNFANAPNTRTNTNRSVGIEGRHYESGSERLVEFDAGALHLLAVKADDSLGYHHLSLVHPNTKVC